MAIPDVDSNSVVRMRSAHDVARTVERLLALLAAHGLRVFADIDFARDAAASGLTLRPERLVVFGSPKSGTPLLAAAPTVGLDLPLKALVWQDEAGITFLSYNDPAYVLDRHGFDNAVRPAIEAMSAALKEMAEKSIKI